MNIQFNDLENVAFKQIFGQASQEITSLSFHSKQVKPGDFSSALSAASMTGTNISMRPSSEVLQL